MSDNDTSRQGRLIEVMSGQARGPWPAALRGLAAAASVGYAGVVRTRNRLYDLGRLASRSLDRPVVSVGNITAGGTGKTVLVAELARWVRDAGRTPAVLTRGYKGDDSPIGSDEAAELRARLPGLAVEADPDRTSAGRRLLAGDNPPDIFLLDDGFQHRRLRRDIDLVALDATRPLDGPLMRVLPRGLLREPPGGLARADCIVLTRADQAPEPMLARMAEQVRTLAPTTPILQCRHAPTALATPEGERPIEALAGRRFLVFCGLGNPAGFSATVAKLGGECVDFVAFDDHHVYTPAELADLARRARAADADLLLTTGKDRVKLSDVDAGLPVWWLNVAIEWLTAPAVLKDAVLGLLGS